MVGAGGVQFLDSSNDYDFVARYEIHVHSEIDGREVAHATVDLFAASDRHGTKSATADEREGFNYV